jgi:hypothetical protein
MATIIKMVVFWDVAPCNIVHTDGRFRDAYCYHIHGDDRAVNISEMSVNFYRTTRCNFTEGSPSSVELSWIATETKKTVDIISLMVT